MEDKKYNFDEYDDISSSSDPNRKNGFYINTDFEKDENISSNTNSQDIDDNVDLFSYDNSSNILGDENEEFDLNKFSSKTFRRQAEKRTKKDKRNLKNRILKTALTIFLIGLITVTIVVGAFIFYAFTMVDGTMNVDLTNELDFTTVIYVMDENGDYVEYKRLSGEYNRIWMDFDRARIESGDKTYKGIPQMLANAFVAIEDKRFFEHDGIDWKRTMGAFVNEFLPIYSSRQGGSTITQQLVKNITSDNEQKASRKVREIMRARFLEGKFSKDEILECYLNTIPMGNGTYGVEVAANYYFGKTVNDLTIAECACLASITKAPSNYAPDSEANLQRNKERRENVLYQMYDQGYITKKEYDKAMKEEIKIVADKRVLNQLSINSYFIDALIDDVITDLEKTYGYERSYASEVFYTSGLKIYATVNPEIQAAAEKVFTDSETYAIKGKDGSLMTGAITVMDYEGNVKALVGNIGEKTDNRGFNCALEAVRQPGSTMKPLAAYAPSIERNLITYSTKLNDTKTKYKDWTPKNWYNSYRGYVTTQYALECSINTIPVALVNQLSPDVSYKFVTERLGVTTLNPGTNGDIDLSPLGLGGTNGGLTTLQSAAAYATFGNGGIYYEPILYTEVVDQNGDTILYNQSKYRVAMSEDTATIMNKLLQTVVTGSSGTGKDVKKYLKNQPIYAKTGTSNDQNDLWFVGGTPYYVASVWCGFSDEMIEIPYAHKRIALKMWGNVMGEVHKDLKKAKFEVSPYVTDLYYCTDSGDLATDACPKVAVGWYKKNYKPLPCSKHSGALLEEPSDKKPSSEENKDNSQSENNTEVTE